jgi:hypothetical protein
MNIGALVIINFDDFIPPSSRKTRTYILKLSHVTRDTYHLQGGAGGMDGWMDGRKQ